MGGCAPLLPFCRQPDEPDDETAPAAIVARITAAGMTTMGHVATVVDGHNSDVGLPVSPGFGCAHRAFKI